MFDKVFKNATGMESPAGQRQSLRLFKGNVRGVREI